MSGFRTVDAAALKQLLEDYGADFRQNKRSYVFNCPRCDKKDKLMMFKSDGKFICWYCAETSAFKGRPEFALVELLGLPMAEIKKRIYGDSAGATPTNFFNLTLADFYGDEDEIPPELVKHVKGMAWPLDFYPIDHPHGAKGRAYLEQRGITLEVAKQHGLRYCPVQKRVIFPINVGEKLLGWQARAIFPTEWEDEEGNPQKAPKILTTGHKDTALMFQDQLAGSDHAIICEGPVDALKCHLAGGYVATMGKVVSDEQMEIVKRSGVRKVYVALDDDASTEIMKLANVFSDYLGDLSGNRFELYKLSPAPGYEDLGAMPPELVLQQFLNAPPLNAGDLILSLEA